MVGTSTTVPPNGLVFGEHVCKLVSYRRLPANNLRDCIVREKAPEEEIVQQSKGIQQCMESLFFIPCRDYHSQANMLGGPRIICPRMFLNDSKPGAYE